MEFRGEEDQELTTPQLSLQFSGVERLEDGQKTITDFLGRSERAPSTKHDLVSPYAFPKWQPPFRAPKVECEIPVNSWKCSECRHQINLLDPTHETLVQQHQDYHLALELSRPVDYKHERDPSLAPAPKRIKRPATCDIRRFFKPQ
jgi:hypothetical protein